MPARHVTPQVVASALCRAAAEVDREPLDLSADDYRAFRSRRLTDERLPSDFTISLLFGSWGRACREASAWARAAGPRVG